MWLNPANPQLDKKGQLHHLLTLEGLPAEILRQILDTAKSFVGTKVKKVPLLRGRSVFNVFFEPSTRTRTTFEIAAKRLSADVINLNVTVSSQSKGESLLDTVDNLSAMHADMFVVRHNESGAPHFIARHVAPDIHVINAGDGAIRTRPRACSTCTPSATTRETSPTSGWRSSATCCTRGWRARKSTRSPPSGAPRSA